MNFDSLNTAENIKEMALATGYSQCGIIPLSELDGYHDKLVERIQKYPSIDPHCDDLKEYATLWKRKRWAKSVVICVRNYSRYEIPDRLNGMIGKYYLTDSRRDLASNDFQDSVRFENWIKSLGVRIETDRDFGIVPLRWAAAKAGLGIIRKNNFFYTGEGSYLYLEGFLIDQEMKLTQNSLLKPCPEGCHLCISHCPTKSLSEPYSMNRNRCISCLTTWDSIKDLSEEDRSLIGDWIYGCDICQDVCPHNRNKWRGGDLFHDTLAVNEFVVPEEIVLCGYEKLNLMVAEKFWYIGRENLWKWKINCLNYLKNNLTDPRLKVIKKAVSDENEHVRRFARKILDEV